MTPDAPSPLRNALLRSIPGAALLSIPTILWIQPQLGVFIGLEHPPSWRFVAAGFGVIATIALCTSSFAMKQLTATKGDFRSRLLRVFNFIVLCIATSVVCLTLGLGVIAIFWAPWK